MAENCSIDFLKEHLSDHGVWWYCGSDVKLEGNSVPIFVNKEPKSGTAILDLVEGIAVDEIVQIVAPCVPKGLRLVVLNSYCSDGLAAALREQAKVPAVIYWKTPAEDTAAHLFGKALAESLATDKPPDQAFQAACNAVESALNANGQQKYELKAPDLTKLQT